MASGSIDINRYVDCNGRQGVNKSISYSASSSKSITANNMEYPEIPAGYISIMSGMYIANTALIHCSCLPDGSGTGNVAVMRNASTSAQNSKSTSLYYTYLLENMIDDQRSLTTYDNTGISPSSGNIAIGNRKLLLRRYKCGTGSIAVGSLKRVLPGDMTPAYYIPPGYTPIAITRFTTGSAHVVIDYVFPTNDATQSSSYFIAMKNSGSQTSGSGSKASVDVLFAPSAMVEIMT